MIVLKSLQTQSNITTKIRKINLKKDERGSSPVPQGNTDETKDVSLRLHRKSATSSIQPKLFGDAAKERQL